MIVRLTHINVLPERVEEFKRIYHDDLIPVVKQQKGNLDCRLLEPVDKSDSFISMTVWDNKESADAYHSGGTYRELVEKVRSLFVSEPNLKVYQAEDIMETA